MKEKKNIHNLDSLELEIYRLQLEGKNMEEKLVKNLDYLQDNYWAMAMNSFFNKTERKKNGESRFWKNFFKQEGFNTTINRIAGNIAGKASEGLHGWMTNFLGKDKQ